MPNPGDRQRIDIAGTEGGKHNAYARDNNAHHVLVYPVEPTQTVYARVTCGQQRCQRRMARTDAYCECLKHNPRRSRVPKCCYILFLHFPTEPTNEGPVTHYPKLGRNPNDDTHLG